MGDNLLTCYRGGYISLYWASRDSNNTIYGHHVTEKTPYMGICNNTIYGHVSDQEPTETSKQPVRTCYLGHVNGYQPMRDQYRVGEIGAAGVPTTTDRNNSRNNITREKNFEYTSYRSPGRMGEWLHIMLEPTETSKPPIRTRYLGHVTGYQSIRYQYFLIRSVLDSYLFLEEIVVIFQSAIESDDSHLITNHYPWYRRHLTLCLVQVAGRPSHALARGYFVTNHYPHLMTNLRGTTNGYEIRLLREREELQNIWSSRDLFDDQMISLSWEICRHGIGSVVSHLITNHYPWYRRHLTLCLVQVAGRPSHALARGYFVTNHYPHLMTNLRSVHLGVTSFPCISTVPVIGRDDTSEQPIRIHYLGHVTGYQPIRDQYFLIWSLVSPSTVICVSPALAVSPSSVHLGVTSFPCISTVPVIGRDDTSEQPIRIHYLGHVTGYQPIRDQYFLIWSVPEQN
eukprot:sb/3464559/